MKKVLIALGGNAILRPGDKGTADEQLANLKYTCKLIAELVSEGYKVIITHGNGPQVGNIYLQNILAQQEVPPMSLDICGAESQGMLGFFIQQSLRNELKKCSQRKNVLTVITQVLVDQNDSGFKFPSKPIGPFYTFEEMKKKAKEGEKWVEDSGRGWRKVVPSPQPIKIIELESISQLVENDTIVIAAGGGGIPVIEKNGELCGVEAVIDKDRASSLMARQLDADLFIILTDVPQVAINFGSPEQEFLDSLDITLAKNYLTEGQFGKGSMAPKVEAAISFAETGKPAVIAALKDVKEAVKLEAGTKILP